MNALLVAAVFFQVGAGAGVIESARVRAGAEVSFHAVVSQETVYVGQAARYELGVFIRDDIRQRLRRNPEFVPPDLRALFSYDLREATATRMVERNGVSYEVHRFRRALYPVAPGRIRIPPARLSYAVPTGASFFSREETRSLESEAVTIVAIQPPERGRPADWNGAVGDLRLQSGPLPTAARRGDPFVYTLRVAGEGYVGLFPRPSLEIPGATVVASDERLIIDSLPDRLTGTKEFDWLVTPDATGTLNVPSVSYAYFDPVQRSYRTTRSTGGSISVRDAEAVALDTAVAPTVTARALAYSTAWRAPRWPAPLTSWWYWVLLGMAPLPVVARAWRRRRRRRRRASAPSAPRAKLHDAAIEATPGAHRALFFAAIEDRLGSAVSWTAAPAAIRQLRRAGVTAETAARVVDAAARLDEVSYGPALTSAHAPAVRELRQLVEAVDREAVRRPRPRAGAARTAAILLLLSVGVGIGAQQRRTAPQYFADGLAAISEDPRTAATAFFAAAERAPHATVAWRNGAIASWAAADTARTVVGWQQVVRRRPLNGEAREQLRAIGASSSIARADVWPVPVAPLAWLGLLLWAAAWAWAWRGGRVTMVSITALVALGLVAVATIAQARLRSDDLAVVATSAPLRALPALGSESGATPLTGEIVLVLERGPVWARVDAGSGRVGWIDARVLLALDGRPLRD